MDSAAGTLDLLAALLTGRAPPTEGDDHRRLLALLATSLAVLVGCGVALLVRRSSAASPQAVKAPPVSAAANKKAKGEEEPGPDDGRPRVVLLFGTQTGTAEGFAKVPSCSRSGRPLSLFAPATV